MNDGVDPVNRMFALLSFPEPIPQTVELVTAAISHRWRVSERPCFSSYQSELAI